MVARAAAPRDSRSRLRARPHRLRRPRRRPHVRDRGLHRLRGDRDLPRRGPRPPAHDPPRHLRRVVLIGVFYTVRLWALVIAWGDEAVVEAAGADPGGLHRLDRPNYLGPIAGHVVTVLLVTSLFAASWLSTTSSPATSSPSSQHRDVPRRLGPIHPRHQSPHLSSLVQTGTALVFMATFAVAGLDPVAEVFTWLAGVATLGVLVLMVLTCLAVLVYFARSGADGGCGTRASPRPSACSGCSSASCSRRELPAADRRRPRGRRSGVGAVLVVVTLVASSSVPGPAAPTPPA